MNKNLFNTCVFIISCFAILFLLLTFNGTALEFIFGLIFSILFLVSGLALIKENDKKNENV